MKGNKPAPAWGAGNKIRFGERGLNGLGVSQMRFGYQYFNFRQPSANLNKRNQADIC